MRITPEYLELNRRMHDSDENYGTSGHRWAAEVEQCAMFLQTTSILDYGCGKETLAAALPAIPIRGYDPCIKGKDGKPAPADLLVCTDVLEHVEEQCINAVLTHMAMLTRRLCLIVIDTGPALKTLADGRNAHILQRDAKWWLSLLMRYWAPAQFQMAGNPKARNVFFIGRSEEEERSFQTEVLGS